MKYRVGMVLRTIKENVRYFTTVRIIKIRELNPNDYNGESIYCSIEVITSPIGGYNIGRVVHRFGTELDKDFKPLSIGYVAFHPKNKLKRRS